MKNFITILAATILAATVLHAQDYMEEPSPIPNGGPYVTKTMEVGDLVIRSYTYRYDTERKVARWVAYPLNAALIGSGTRGDGWAPDSSIPEKYQPVLYKGFPYGSGYDRGHQIPSADRLEPMANQQTFTFTNATPQLHDFNGGIWAEFEKLVRTWAKRSDTLYVVTGIIPGDEFLPDNDNGLVNIPSAYYKTVLRRSYDKRGRVRWSVCSVVLPHKIFPVGTWKENAMLLRDYSLPLRKLEELTGEVYFPLLYNVTGASEYEKLKAADPAKEGWWWK